MQAKLGTTKNSFSNRYGISENYINIFIERDRRKKAYAVVFQNGFKAESVFLSQSHEKCIEVVKHLANDDDLNDFYVTIRDLLKLHNSYIYNICKELNFIFGD